MIYIVRHGETDWNKEKRYGLGLSIAKATVLKNNGTIEVDYKDGYTIFKVELPI